MLHILFTTLTAIMSVNFFMSVVSAGTYCFKGSNAPDSRNYSSYKTAKDDHHDSKILSSVKSVSKQKQDKEYKKVAQKKAQAEYNDFYQTLRKDMEPIQVKLHMLSTLIFTDNMQDSKSISEMYNAYNINQKKFETAKNELSKLKIKAEKKYVKILKNIIPDSKDRSKVAQNLSHHSIICIYYSDITTKKDITTKENDINNEAILAAIFFSLIKQAEICNGDDHKIEQTIHDTHRNMFSIVQADTKHNEKEQINLGNAYTEINTMLIEEIIPKYYKILTQYMRDTQDTKTKELNDAKQKQLLDNCSNLGIDISPSESYISIYEAYNKFCLPESKSSSISNLMYTTFNFDDNSLLTKTLNSHANIKECDGYKNTVEAYQNIKITRDTAYNRYTSIVSGKNTYKFPPEYNHSSQKEEVLDEEESKSNQD